MRRKQLWAGMLAAVLCIGSLAGCGGNKDDAGNGDTGTVEQTEAKSDDGEDAVSLIWFRNGILRHTRMRTGNLKKL